MQPNDSHTVTYYLKFDTDPIICHHIPVSLYRVFSSTNLINGLNLYDMVVRVLVSTIIINQMTKTAVSVFLCVMGQQVSFVWK